MAGMGTPVDPLPDAQAKAAQARADQAQADPAQHEHLHQLLQEFSTVMLGTFERSGDESSFIARPMHVARLEADCSMTFLSAIGTDKVDEALRTHAAQVIGQSKTRFFTMRGQVSVSRDRGRVRELWSGMNEIWFDGPDDPRIVLIDFYPEEAELWDASGVNGLRFLFQAAKALVSGKPPTDAEQRAHARMKLDH